MCETIEFIVVIRAGGALWKHSMVTMNMESFRGQPEFRFEQWWPLGSVSKLDGGAPPANPAETFGDLHLVAT